MKRIIVVLFCKISIIQMFILGLLNTVYANSDTSEDVNLTEIADKAYIYTLPLYIMYRTRWNRVFNSDRLPRAKLNEFRHRRKLADPNSREVTAPNNDTIYSSAFLDLAREPLVLHVPNTSGRYYVAQFLDFYTDNFASAGRRTTGTHAGDYLVVGPSYEGETPSDLPIIKSPTNVVWLITRFLIDGPGDLSNVHALQNQLRITPLSSRMKLEPNRPRDKPSGVLIEPNPFIGNYDRRYFLRAIVAVMGLGALNKEEAMYFRAIPEGEPFHGRNRYVLHFEKDGLPPVDAFWSLTMYRVEAKDSRADRYAGKDRQTRILQHVS
jgi:hypothetical protein